MIDRRRNARLTGCQRRSASIFPTGWPRAGRRGDRVEVRGLARVTRELRGFGTCSGSVDVVRAKSLSVRARFATRIAAGLAVAGRR